MVVALAPTLANEKQLELSEALALAMEFSIYHRLLSWPLNDTEISLSQLDLFEGPSGSTLTKKMCVWSI